MLEELKDKFIDEKTNLEKKEMDALTKAIESKTARVSELGVKVAEMENDLEDTKEQLAEDKKIPC